MKKIIPLVFALISLLSFVGSVNAQNKKEFCEGEMKKVENECERKFEECDKPCSSLIGAAWSACRSNTNCVGARYDCLGQLGAVYDKCFENNATPTVSEPSPADEKACHESCQSDFDTCTSDCQSSNIFKNSNTESYSSQIKRDDCFNTWHSCSTAIYGRSGCEYGACQKEAEETCDKPYFVCLKSSNGSTNVGVSSLDSCWDVCKQTKSTCDQSCRATKQTIGKDQSSEKPSVEVSSTDFEALARANAEYQQAQAELKKIKQSNDPRWEAKKDFAQKFQDNLHKYPDEQKDILQITRDRLEEVKSDVELYQKVKDLAKWVKGTDIDTDSGNMGTVIAVGNGLNDFLDLIADGVPVEDAVTKVLIDSTAVDLVPFAGEADMVAKLPDEILSTLGIPPDHWSRKPTVYLAKNSPSAFVELTTDTMIKTHNFTNVGGALQVAWNDVETAEGFGEKAKATVDLVGTAVGAVPVAIAMQARDTISTLFDTVKSGGGNITGIFTNQFWSPD